ncbi:hypothetical protein [Photobacterium lipolyticum]|uniref:Uncharacterized protein n=1 Tax=Photobacterium lipolyticum TaxID=266810 RepID=A0A2T3MWI4_9GAMM|nr:hypothetical protein [Photobacterium lipolyticum]PSW04302.1 hypothetical protein C9I89_13300 [Photobacterium lipolyticum]
MTILIILFGILTLFAGIVIIIKPEIIFSFLRNHLDKPILHILAVAVRLVLGVFLIYQSNVSRFPLVIEVIGWISIVAAIIFAVIGRRNFKRLMSWALSLAKPIGRIGGVIAGAFGAFLIYAFV